MPQQQPRVPVRLVLARPHEPERRRRRARPRDRQPEPVEQQGVRRALRAVRQAPRRAQRVRVREMACPTAMALMLWLLVLRDPDPYLRNVRLKVHLLGSKVHQDPVAGKHVKSQ